MKKSNLIISAPPLAAEPEHCEEIDPEREVRPLFFDVHHHGRRLDLALTDEVPEFSRNYLQQLIALGAVSLNGQVVRKPSHKIKASDSGTIELRPTPQSQAFKAEPPELDVIDQDECLLVINKPAGLVVHPAPGNWSGTLMNQLLGFDAKAFALPRAGIVHRLDKDTSGLMVVARTRPVMDALVQAIAARTVKRHYLALAHGSWQGSRCRLVDAPIGRDPSNRLRMAVVTLSLHAGKPAQTDVECLASNDKFCLVKCALHTGRTHQIRVHMAQLGHPLVADALYGGSNVVGMTRQALHAFRLAFQHPITRADLVWTCPVPADFQAALQTAGLGYNPACF